METVLLFHGLGRTARSMRQLVPRGHTFILRAPEVIEHTAHFLRHGRFGPRRL